MKKFLSTQYLRCFIIFCKLFKKHNSYYDDIRTIDQIRFALPKYSIKISDFQEDENIIEHQQWCIENFDHKAKMGFYIVKKLNNHHTFYGIVGYLRFKNEEEVILFSLKWL